MAHTLEVRRTTDQELPALVEAFGQEWFFKDRLGRQHEGHGELLVAWLGRRPVGNVYLWLGPADEPMLRQHLPGIPLLNHIEVREPHRRRGYGRAIVLGAELAARRWHRHGRVALAVVPTNVDAARLYRRLGYEDWQHGPIEAAVIRPDGAERGETEQCLILTKSLPGNARSTMAFRLVDNREPS
jgi:GNAT superfamily N-acetyltransferase